MSYKEKHIESNEVKEPMIAYASQSSMTPFYNLFSGLKPSNLSTDYDVLQLARHGFSKRILLSMAKKISLSLQELALIMHISDRTLQRYDDDAIIKTEYAEKAVELARLYTRGQEVFGSLDKFKTWMKTPLYVFKNETPVSLLDTSTGFNMVFKELGRIEHGIFA